MTNTVPKTALQLRSHLKASGELELSLAEVAVPEPGPDDVIIRALEWNDRNGDFEGLERVRLLEIFLADFIVSK